MDHLHAEEEKDVLIPYLYRGPVGKIKTIQELEDFKNVSEHYGEADPQTKQVPPETAALFMQKWLYFGFLSFILSLQDIELNVSAFVRSSGEGGEYITSRSLPSTFDAWISAEKGRPDQGDARTKRFEILNQGFDYTVKAITALRESMDTMEVTSKVLASIQALVFTFTKMVNYRFPEHIQNLPSNIGISKILFDGLEASGWCKYDIARIKIASDFSVAHYCNTRLAPRKQLSHAACSTSSCTAMNIDDKNYRTSHTTMACTCEFIQIPLELLHTVVGNLETPLVQYHAPEQELGHGRLSVHEKKVGEDHVVFSHVWSDGLGNEGNGSLRNALPSCQLDRLQKIANLAFDVSNISLVPFYIDTLCVPADKELRKSAIRKMYDIYASASRVVVLDKDIESLTAEHSIEYKCTTILFSGWMTRLWTYQEGLLSKSLRFKLSDILIDFNDFIGSRVQQAALAFLTTYSPLPSLLGLLAAAVKYLNMFQASDRAACATKLGAIALGIRHRATSHPEDEIIVIASMLGFDVKELLDITGNERMKWLLRNIRNVPAGIAVYSSDRMKEYGYRWAPKSFFGNNEFDNTLPMLSWTTTRWPYDLSRSSDFSATSHFAEVLHNGALRVSSGFMLQRPPGQKQASVNFWALSPNEEFGHNFYIQFIEDKDGRPAPLDVDAAVLIPVQDPDYKGTDFSRISAFVAIPGDDTAKFYHMIREHLFDSDYDLVFKCNFYCRAIVHVFKDISSAARHLTKDTIIKEGKVHAWLCHSLPEVAWIVS